MYNSMTRVEAQKKLSESLAAYTFIFQDAIGKQYSIGSYEKALSFTELGFRAYSGRIKEYADEFLNIKEKIETIISDIVSNETIDIRNAIRTSFSINMYSNTVVLNCVVPESLSGVPGHTLYDIVQIYDEHGLEVLKQYIELLKNPTSLSSYLSSTDKQLAGMEYIVFSTGHHSPKRLRRDLTGRKMLDELRNSYTETLNDITNKKDGYDAFLVEKKQEYQEWSQDVSSRADELFETAEKRRRELEATYDAKLKVEKPADFMEEQSKKYKKSFIMWSMFAVVLAIIVMVLFGVVLSPRIDVGEKLVEIHLFSRDLPIYSSIIIVAMISLIIYIIRIFIKVALSAKHISEEYRQKYALTYFYLSLVNDGKIDKEVEKYILILLFSKADTGLIKGDSNMDTLLVNMIDKSIK